MKKFISALLLLTLMMIALIVYERYFVQSEVGPSTILAVVILSCFALALGLTLIFYDTRLHELISRIWLVTLSIGVTFLVVDLIAGALLIKPLSPELSADKVRHHKLVPNTYSRFEQPDFSYIQHVNNIGIRGEDTTIDKPPNTFRILMLGDSFTMGKGVEDGETFSALLQHRLNEQSACEDMTFEVLNGGTDSYAPILSYLQLSNDLMDVNPDIIMLNLDISDLLQEQAYRDIAVYDDNGDIIAVPGSEEQVLLNQRIRRWIDQHLFFTRLLLFYTNQLFGYKDLTVQGVVTRANSEIVRYTLAEDNADRQEQWNKIFDSILNIRKFADNRDAPFVLVVYPWGHQVNDKEWVPGRYSFMKKDAVASDKYLAIIREMSDKFGIELLNLFPAFRKYEGADPLYFDYDMHWTTEGHKVMAAGLKNYLHEHQLDNACK